MGWLVRLQAGDIGDPQAQNGPGLSAQRLTVGLGEPPEGKAPLGAMGFETHPARLGAIVTALAIGRRPQGCCVAGCRRIFAIAQAQHAEGFLGEILE
jgi:hypothetical protein